MSPHRPSVQPHRFRRIVPALLLVLAALFAHGCAKPGDEGVAAAIQRALAGAKHDRGTIAGRVARFYHERDHRPAWIEQRRPSGDAILLRQALANLPADGLFDAQADVAALDTVLDAPHTVFAHASVSDSALAALDVRLTRAWFTGASRLHDGAVPESRLDKAWRGRESGERPEKRLAEALDHHAAAESLAASAPRDSDYVRLRAALARRLRAFQAAHGLDTTGVADPATRNVMDDSLRAVVSTVAMNLERRRWLRAPRPLPRVEVNIPDATMWARGDSGAVLRMRVIVGDVQHPTPVFSSAITWIDLNPTWTLSRRVIAEEVVPALRRNPHYLQAHDMILMRPIHGHLQEVSSEGAVLDSVASDTFRTYVRQRAGAKNPLGRIRFMLPNLHDVYLHDTNQRGLFARDYRARSHGCVRLQKPMELASWLLSMRSPTPEDSVRAALRDTTGRRLELRRRVPIDVLYWTAWADENGELQVRKDLYGLDARLQKAIESGEAERFELNLKTQWDSAP